MYHLYIHKSLVKNSISKCTLTVLWNLPLVNWMINPKCLDISNAEANKMKASTSNGG